MKYRILYDGNVYAIQTKGIFFWRDVSNGIYGIFPIPLYFKTIKQAERYAKNQWGNSAQRIYSWRIA